MKLLQPAHRYLCRLQETWLAEYKPDDADGGELDVRDESWKCSVNNTLEGWFEGYVLTGRHGVFLNYGSVRARDRFHVQPAAQVAEKSNERTGVARSGALDQHSYHIAGMVARSNGSPSGPGFSTFVTNKSPRCSPIILPPDANCLLSVTDHCLRSARLRQRDRSGQAGSPSVSQYG